MSRPLVLIPVVCAVVLAGCGSSSSDPSSEVSAAAHKYLLAVAEGNGKQACALLTDAQTERVAIVAKGTPGCEDEVAAFHQKASPAILAALREVTVGTPTINGSKATVTTTQGGRTTTVFLVKTSAGWRIEHLQEGASG